MRAARNSSLERRLRRIAEAGRELGLGEPTYYVPKPKAEKKPRYQRPRSHSSHNPDGFTTEEAQTATLILTEGYITCRTSKRVTNKTHIYRYPRIGISMCDREALLPAEKVLRTSIHGQKTKQKSCPIELYPPEGKGTWRLEVSGKKAQEIYNRLEPLLTTVAKTKWKKVKQACK